MEFEAYKGSKFVYVVNEDHRVVYANDAMMQFLPSIQIGKTQHRDLFPTYSLEETPTLSSDREGEMTIFDRALEQWVNVSKIPIEWPGAGECSMVICALASATNRSVVENIPFMAGYDVFMVMNITQDTCQCLLPGGKKSPASIEGETLAGLIGRTKKNIVHPLDQDRFQQFWDFPTLWDRLAAEGTVRDEFMEHNPSGGWDLVHITLVPEIPEVTDDQVIVAMYTVVPAPQLSEIATRANQADQSILPKPTRKDALGSIAWVADVAPRAEGLLDGAPAGHKVILAFDVENFRFFNRWLGRQTGDELLNRFAQYLQKLGVEQGAVVCRTSADGFAAMLSYNLHNLEAIQADLRAIVREVSSNEGYRLGVGCYLIVNVRMPFGDMVDCALSAASKSLDNYGPHLQWYDQEKADEKERLLRMVPEVRQALARDQFEIYLQPKCLMNTEQIVGAEALARWNHPERGILSPAEFIPVLEETGEVYLLDRMVWRKTFQLIAEWIYQGLPVAPISVNVSRQDLVIMDVPKTFADLAQEYHVDPSFVEIEVTESAFMEDKAFMNSVLEKLREEGFSLLIDDFGSGYSSLNMLKDVSVDALKLDLKFLDFTSENASKAVSIVHSVVEMSHLLGVPVIVEGVEKQDQVDILEDMGCQYAQGYLFYKPMPAKQFTQLLERGKALIQGVLGHYRSQDQRRVLLTKNEFYDQVINSVFGPMVLYERRGEDIDIVKFNKQFSRVIGPEELLRRRYSIQQYAIPEDAAVLHALLDKAQANPQQQVEGTITFINERGDRAPYAVSFTLFEQEDGVQRFFGMPHPLTTDVTKAVSLEAQMRMLMLYSSETILFVHKDGESWRYQVVVHGLDSRMGLGVLALEDELNNGAFFGRVDEESREALMKKMSISDGSHRPFTGHFSLQTETGETLHLCMRVDLAEAENGRVAFLATIHEECDLAAELRQG
ncbi:MAG: GGDEF domain-containing phosphodiesterase [Coriobacteriia bacterium]|nr:GGDEF domain-containing phosphodiesterase [Coriobacteriia bacterium]